MMDSFEGASYIENMRKKGLKDEEIRKKLIAAGWDNAEMTQAFAQLDDDTLPPPPPSKQTLASNAGSAPHPQPVAVVQRYTTRGVEYGIMFLSLGIGAISLGTVLHDWADTLLGAPDPLFGLSGAPMASAAALVAIPIFVILFLRLRKAEKTTPELHADSSRRKWVQTTLLVSFVWGIITLIGYLYNLFSGQPDNSSYWGLSDNRPTLDYAANSILQFMHMAITLGIAGSIFLYYWIDEHRQKQ